MNKEITKQDDLAQQDRRMFAAAIASLAEISAALGIDEEEAACANGNTLILAAIARKNAAIMAGMTTKPRVRFLTQAELDSLGASAEGMDGQQWDMWVQEKFAEINGLRLIGSFR